MNNLRTGRSISRCPLRHGFFFLCLVSYALFCRAQPDEVDFKGTWEGTIHLNVTQGLPSDDAYVKYRAVDFQLRIARNGRIGVSARWPDAQDWARWWSFPLRLTRLGKNAVIAGNHKGGSFPGRWVETIVFNMTKLKPDTLLVHWSRVVNNTDRSPDKVWSAWILAGHGEMYQVPD